MSSSSKAERSLLLGASTPNDPEEGHTFDADPSYENVICCTGLSVCLLSMGLVPGMLFRYKAIAERTSTTLTSDSVDYHSAITDCCCHVATKHITIPLENITDVAISTNCCLACCGLKSVTIQTAGSGLPEAVINNLADPDGFREAVLQARKAYREGRRGMSVMPAVTGTMLDAPKAYTMQANPDPISKLKELKDLHDMGVINDQEWDDLKKKVISSPEFNSAKAQVLGRF